MPLDAAVVTRDVMPAYTAWLNSEEGRAAYRTYEAARTANPNDAADALAMQFRTAANNASNVNIPAAMRPALTTALNGVNDNDFKAAVRAGVQAATPSAAPAAPAAGTAPAAPANGPLTLEAARAWVAAQAAAAPQEMRAAWNTVSTQLADMYRDGKALVIKDGKIDTSGLSSWLSARGEDVSRAFNSLSASSGGILGGIWDFVKNNMFTLGAGAVAAFAGNALGLGPIGSILLGLVGAAVGGFLGDSSGFVSNLFGGTRAPAAGAQPPAPQIVVVQGQTVPANTLTNPRQPMTALAANATLATPTAQVQTIAPGVPIPGINIAGLPDNQRPTTSMTITQENRTITYYGKMEGDNFVGSFIRISDAGADTKTTPVMSLPAGGEMRIATTPNGGARQATFDAAASARVIADANSAISVANGGLPSPTLAATNITYRVGQPAPVLEPSKNYNITVLPAGTGTTPIAQYIGSTDAGGAPATPGGARTPPRFVVFSSRVASDQTTGAGMPPEATSLTQPVAVPLAANNSLDMEAAKTAVAGERTRAARAASASNAPTDPISRPILVNTALVADNKFQLTGGLTTPTMSYMFSIRDAAVTERDGQRFVTIAPENFRVGNGRVGVPLTGPVTIRIDDIPDMSTNAGREELTNRLMAAPEIRANIGSFSSTFLPTIPGLNNLTPPTR